MSAGIRPNSIDRGGSPVSSTQAALEDEIDEDVDRDERPGDVGPRMWRSGLSVVEREEDHASPFGSAVLAGNP